MSLLSAVAVIPIIGFFEGHDIPLIGVIVSTVIGLCTWIIKTIFGEWVGKIDMRIEDVKEGVENLHRQDMVKFEKLDRIQGRIGAIERGRLTKDDIRELKQSVREMRHAHNRDVERLRKEMETAISRMHTENTQLHNHLNQVLGRCLTNRDRE